MHLTGLKSEQLKRIGQLPRRRVPPERIFSPELARQMAELSRLINRHLGVLINRQGETAYVIVGNHRQVVIPSLAGFRSSSLRFKGLRLIHTHLNGEKLSNDDLALLRLDLICAISVLEDGRPGLAHLIPEDPDSQYWITSEMAHPSEV